MAQPAVRARVLLSLCILFLLFTTPAAAQTLDDPYVASELILSFAPGATALESQGVLDELGATEVVRFNRIDGGLYRLESMTVEEALQLVDGNPYLALAEPNYIVYEHVIPDDPRFDELWGMENTGQTGGTPGADISATDAWNVFTGSGDVVVGVIDTGLDMSHPDIAANVFVNEGEIPGNGIDDDNNGFIDDVNGWDFANNDNNPFDDRGHGTHVSGTIGGVGNNGVGVAGVNWTVRILPIKFLGSGGTGTTADAVRAVEYATLMGVDLTNNSWGGGGFSSALQAAIEDAGAAGIHFVASAGNSGRNNDSSPAYPASYDSPNIISVAATNHNDQLAGFSNYGAVTVDIGAPGVNILSTVPGSGYAFYDGTSMAAPHVSGVVAMMVGRFPTAPREAIKQRLLTMADPIPALAGRTVSGARLNAFMAITDPDDTPPAPVNDLAVLETGSNWLRVAWSATGDDGTEGRAVSYEMRRATFPLDEANFSTGILVEGLPSPKPYGEPEEHVVDGLDFLTTYWVALVARDEFGNTSLVSNSPSGTTLGIPTATVSPSSLSEALLTGATSSQSLSLSNTGEGTLDFEFGPVEFTGAPTASAVATVPGEPIETYLALYEADPLLAAAAGIDGASTPEGFMGRSPSSVVSDYFDYLQSMVDGTVIYSDDMEGGAPGWTHAPTSGPVDQWALVTTRSASGNYSWRVSQHSSYGADALLSPPIDLPDFPELRLAFEHWYQFDDCGADPDFEPDGGIVEVSTDGGASWTQIFPLAGYPYVLDDVCDNPLANLDAYSHDGGAGTAFVPAVFDLSAFGGNTVLLRFHAGWDCGNCDNNEGWYVDDVTVFADVPPWLGVDLVSGSLSAGETAEVGVMFNAAGLFGGLHTADLVIGSNDPVSPELRVPVSLAVTGAPDIAASPGALDFGAVFVDGSEQRTLLIQNVGTDVLTISDISVDHADFALSATSAVLGFSESVSVDVTYAPTAPGAVQPTITILSDDPDEPTFLVTVSAAGIEPPDVSVVPTSMASDLFTGGFEQQTLTINNEGVADLVFSLEAFAVDRGLPSSAGPLEMTSERIVELTAEDGAALNGEPVLATGLERVYGTDPSILVYTDNTRFSPGNNVAEQALQRMGLAYTVEYGSPSNFNQLLITGTWDLVIIDNSLRIMEFGDVEAYVTAGGALIASYWDIDGTFGGPAPLWAMLGLDHAAELLDASPVFRWNTGHPLFTRPNVVPDFSEMVDTVNDNGDKFNGTGTAQVIAGFTPTATVDQGGFLVSGAHAAIVHGFLPGENASDLDGDSILDAVELYENEIGYLLGGAPWLSVEPLEGTVPGGQSFDVSVSFDAAGLNGGSYAADILLASNDPDEPEVTIATTLTVTGAADIVVTPESLDFGPVFVTGSATLSLQVDNVGTDLLDITSIAAGDPALSPSVTSLVLAVGESGVIEVTYAPTSPVALDSDITLVSNDPDDGTVVIPVLGTGVAPPVIAVSPTSVEVALFTGEATNRTVTVRNDGATDLELEVAITAADGPAAATLEPGALERFGAAFSPVAASTEDPFSAGHEPQFPKPEPKRDHQELLASTLAGSGLSVLIVHAGDVSQIQSLLLAFPDIGVVDALDGSFTTPTLEDLLAYDAVIVAPNSQLANKALLGDTLADYVDAGGGVVETTPAFVDGRSPEGRWLTEAYSPYELGFGPIGTAALADFDPTHPLMEGVTTASVGLVATADLRPDATWVADLTNGEGFVATNDRGVVSVNVFVANSGYWSGDIPLLLRNAVAFSAGGPPWLSVEPTAAVIPAGQSVDLDLAFDAAGLIGGVYSAVLEMTSNDPVRPLLELPVTLDVTGAPDIVVDPLALDFGELFVGATATLEFTVENLGTDVLTVSSIAASDAHVGVSAESLVLAVEDAAAVGVDWAPVAAGPLAATLTLLSDDPDQPVVEVSLTGLALEPPDVAVTPASLESDLFTGEIDLQTLTISNEGVADLDFSLRALVVNRGLPGSSTSLPVTSERIVELSAEDALAPNGEPVLATGLERVYGADPSILVYTDNTRFSPGNNVVEQALQRLGLAYTVEYGSPSNFNQRLVAGTWDLVIIDNSLRIMGFSDVEDYVVAGGALIVSYWDIDGTFGGPAPLWATLGLEHAQENLTAQPIYRWDTGHALFSRPNEVPDFTQMVDTVTDNGDKFNGVGTAQVVAGFTPTTTVGQGGLLISGAHAAIVHGFLPGENLSDLDGDSILDAVELYENEIGYMLGGTSWLSVEPREGTIPGGQSLDVDVTFDANGMFGGVYEADILLTSNDPDEPEVTIPTTLTVTGIPLIAIDPGSLDFGWLYLTQQATLQLTVRNDGTEALEVTGVASDDGQFTADLTAFTIEPLQQQTVNVTFLAATPGAIEASLIFTHNAAEGTTAVPITATAVVPPEIVVAATSLEAAAMPEGRKVKTLTVRNEGGSDLSFSVASQLSVLSVPVFNPDEVEKGEDYDLPGILGSGGPDVFGYSWIDSDQPGGPVFDWVDISATGTPLYSRIADDVNVGPIPIGFTFPFYGNEFTELRVCANGWISFTSSSPDFSNAPLPGAASPENLLAVFHDDLLIDPDNGSQVFWEFDGERLIVQFDNVRRLGFGGPYTFQALLYPTGKIVYQYLSMQGHRLDEATIGIQNAARDDGLTIAYNVDYVHDEMAIRIGTPPNWLSFEPASAVVAPGESVDLTMTFDATDMEAGDYTGNLTFTSNDITDPMVGMSLLFHVGTVAAADTDADPNTLNVAANGKWMTVYVELPPEYDPAQVLVETVTLNEVVPAASSPFANDEDFNGNGIPDLMFKFDWAALAATLPEGDSVELTISGEIEDTMWFVTTDTIRVINPTMKAPNGGEVLAAGYQYPLVWELPAEWDVTHSDLLWTPDDGVTWLEIARDVGGTSLMWDVPAAMTTESARVRVFVYDSEGLLGYDTSDAVFEIAEGSTDVPSSPKPRSFALMQNSPNPFNPRTTIRFDLPWEEHVSLTIYDARGRLVKTLLSGPKAPGSHEVIWDGDDNGGSRVATGIYYCRIAAGGFTATRTMVLMK